jgi:hypothetical protein
MSVGAKVRFVGIENTSSDDDYSDREDKPFYGVHLLLISKGIGSVQANVMKTQVTSKGTLLNDLSRYI